VCESIFKLMYEASHNSTTHMSLYELHRPGIATFVPVPTTSLETAAITANGLPFAMPI
jgi:hypothetical protein